MSDPEPTPPSNPTPPASPAPVPAAPDPAASAPAPSASAPAPAASAPAPAPATTPPAASAPAPVPSAGTITPSGRTITPSGRRIKSPAIHAYQVEKRGPGRAIVALCAIFLVAAGGYWFATLPPTMRELRSPDGKFTVNVPEIKTGEDISRAPDHGSLRFGKSADEGLFVLRYSEPQPLPTGDERVKLFESLRDQALKDSGAASPVARDSKPFTLGDAHGTEFTYDTKNGTTTIRVFEVAGRFYVMQASVPRSQAGQLDALFLDSFKLAR